MCLFNLENRCNVYFSFEWSLSYLCLFLMDYLVSFLLVDLDLLYDLSSCNMRIGVGLRLRVSFWKISLLDQQKVVID